MQNNLDDKLFHVVYFWLVNHQVFWEENAPDTNSDWIVGQHRSHRRKRLSIIQTNFGRTFHFSPRESKDQSGGINQTAHNVNNL